MARKVIGYTFIVTAILGFLFSLAGIVLVWTVKAPLTANIFSTLDLLDTTLEATSSGFTIVDETLSNTISDLSSIENTVQTAGNGIDDSVPLIQSLSTLLSENIPQAITATQTGLTSLQDAAGTFESTLRLVTSIPFLPIEGYDPEISFSAAIEDVSQSLDAIPQSLTDMESTMNSTEGNLVMLGAQINIIARNISELKNSFYEIQLVFDQYQEVIVDLQGRIDTFRGNLQTGITITAWIFTIIFIWLGIAQLALLTQGLERVDFRSNESSSDTPFISDDTSIDNAPENANSNSEPADD